MPCLEDMYLMRLMWKCVCFSSTLLTYTLHVICEIQIISRPVFFISFLDRSRGCGRWRSIINVRNGRVIQRRGRVALVKERRSGQKIVRLGQGRGRKGCGHGSVTVEVVIGRVQAISVDSGKGLVSEVGVVMVVGVATVASTGTTRKVRVSHGLGQRRWSRSDFHEHIQSSTHLET